MKATIIRWVLLGGVLSACGQPRIPHDPTTSPTVAPPRPPAPPSPTWGLEHAWNLDRPASEVFVAMQGDTLAVLARFIGSDQTLIVYRRDRDAWSEVQRMPLARASRSFGGGVDMQIDGDTMLVDRAVLARREGTWEVEHIFDDVTSDGAPSVFPGALSGDTVVASGPSRSVVIYERRGGAWTEVQELHDDGSSYASIGYRTVAISGDRIVVGDFALQGVVWVYQRDATGRWGVEEKVTPPDDDRNFGLPVSIDGNSLAAQSSGSDSITRVFVHDGRRWISQAALEGPEPEPGSDVLIDGEDLVYGLNYRRGQLEVYAAQRRLGVWSRWSTITLAGDRPHKLGHYRAVAMSGGVLAIGSTQGKTATIRVFKKS